jgi:serine/threonine-protein kinase
MPALTDRSARLQLLGEITQGGMGAILKGRDVDIGRDLAVKVLLINHKEKPELIRRFLEEAQITGQLQHPGIPPVHELGTLPDGRPFFTMKLVKGRTLASLLSERPGPSHDLPCFVGIFEVVCQTVAYAHARGVIHRDLKPSNVMIGNFGEALVMDWGLAKVLRSPDTAAEQATEGWIIPTVIHTARGDTPADASRAGTLLGTPPYMSPEQARGDVDRVDERADVFALGSMLCEVLTGAPAYSGSSAEVLLRKAAAADLTDAFARLDACRDVADLVALAKACLIPAREARPRDARAVADAVTAYLAGVQAKLKAAELATVEAQTRAQEEQKHRVVADQLAIEAQARADEEGRRARVERDRRRLTVALAASVLLTAGLGAGGWAQLAVRQAGIERRVELAYADAAASLGRARGSGRDVVAWAAVGTEADALGRLLDANPVRRDLADRVARLRAEASREADAVGAAAEADRKDRVLLDALVAARSARAEVDVAETVDLFARAFADYGLDPTRADDLSTLIHRLSGRPESMRVAIAAGLDEWAIRAYLNVPRSDAWRRPLALAEALDPEPTRLAVRRAFAHHDGVALRRMAAPESIDQLEPIAVILLAQVLAVGPDHDLDVAIATLRNGLLRYPRDVRLNWLLGFFLQDTGPEGHSEAIPYYRVAFALQPATGHQLAHLLSEQGRGEEALAVSHELAELGVPVVERFRNLTCYGTLLLSRGNSTEAASIFKRAVAAGQETIRLKPDHADTHYTLGLALQNSGDLPGAIQAYREAIRLKPDHATAHSNLGGALCEFGDLPGATAACREAIRLKPDLAGAHNNLGQTLRAAGDLAAAIAALREAIRLEPNDAMAHNNLGVALRESGDLPGAIAAFREAIRLKPDYARAQYNLGIALSESDDLRGAIAAYREAVRLKFDHADAYHNLGVTLQNSGDLPGAIAAYREAIRLQPDYAPSYYNLGNALLDSGDLPGAVAAHREATRLRPDDPRAHANLGNSLRQQGCFAESLAEYRTAHKLGSKVGWREASADWVAEAERLVALAQRLPAILKGRDRPGDNAERLTLAQMAYDTKQYPGAARLWSEAMELNPELADDRRVRHRYNAACSSALAAAGQGIDDPPPDDAAKTQLRQQARAWLNAELEAWTKLLESATRDQRQVIAKTLQHWQTDPDLAGIRDAEAIAKLPKDERSAWHALWADVDALLKKSEGM